MKTRMFRLICSSVILFSTACAETEMEIEESGGKTSGKEILIYAQVDQPAHSDDSKTVLGDNGFEVNWETEDTVGFINVDRDNCGTLNKMPLKQGAGSPDGVFTLEGFDADGAYSLRSFLYPAPKDLGSLQKTGEKYTITLNLDNEQTSYASGHLGKYDFKSSTTFKKIEENAYEVKFRQRIVFLNFVVYPTQDMVTDGEKLRSVTLTAPNAIAGNFSLSLKENDPPIEVPADGWKTVSVSPDSDLTLSDDTPSELRMFVLPNVCKGDILTINLETDNYNATVSANASKDYCSGYKYTMTVNLPELVSAGKATVVKGGPFIKNEKDFGIFDISDPASPQPELIVDENWQCGEDVRAGIFRMVNWQDKKILWIKHPSQMSQGETVNLELSSYGDTAYDSGTISAVVLKMKDGTCWLRDDNAGKGYIIKTAIQ